MTRTARRAVCCQVLCATALLSMGAAHATEAAHVHGLMRIDIAVDKHLLTLQLESPLDSLLGFEHRPRTPAQRQAADVLRQQMNEGAALFKADAAARCTLTRAAVESAVFQNPATGGNESEHADLDASYEFTCANPDKLTAVDIGLFDAFPRLQKIEVQVAAAKGQSKQTLQRPARSIRLTR